MGSQSKKTVMTVITGVLQFLVSLGAPILVIRLARNRWRSCRHSRKCPLSESSLRAWF